VKTVLHIGINLLFLVVSLSAKAADVGSQFEAANKLYGENKFAEAATAYEKIIASGTFSPVLYFNLGNAHFKAGHLGHAIAAYRNTSALTPRDPDLIANLKFARDQVQGPTIRPEKISRMLSTFTLSEWTWLTTIGVWITFALLIATQIKPALKPALKTMTIVATTLTVMIGICLTTSFYNKSARQTAIVTVEEATVRNSPIEQSPSTFVAQDGAELIVLDAKDDWLQVSDGTRRIGWMRSASLTLSDR